MNELLESAPAEGNNAVKHFAERLYLEIRPNHWEKASPRAINVFMKSLARAGAQTAWQLLESDAVFFQERPVPNHRWGQFLFVALARKSVSAALWLVTKAGIRG